mgnify:CR=1 FL=1
MIGTRVQFLDCGATIASSIGGTVMDKVRVGEGNGYAVDYYVIVDKTDKIWIVHPHRIQKLLKSEEGKF